MIPMNDLDHAKWIKGMKGAMFHGMSELLTENDIVRLCDRVILLEAFVRHCKESHSLPDICCLDLNKK